MKRIVTILLLLVILSLPIVRIPTVSASSLFSITHSSGADFSGGVAGGTLDLEITPGDIKLKKEKDIYQPDDQFYSSINNGVIAGMTGLEPSGELMKNLYEYSPTSDPAIPENVIALTRFKSMVDYDESTNLLYIPHFGSNWEDGGLYVIDTKGTYLQSDDEIVSHYTSTSTPALDPAAIISGVLYDDANDLLYILGDKSTSPFKSWVFVIDTGGTITQSDDVLLHTYTFNDMRIWQIQLSPSLDAIYLPTYWSGIRVINRMGSYDPTDDTFGVYTTGTTPAIQHNYTGSVFVDEGTQYLYTNTAGGIRVFDTNGTPSIADDTILASYTTTSTPALPSNDHRGEIWYNPTNCLIYSVRAFFYGSLDLIDTNCTDTQADDSLLFTYSKTSTPALIDFVVSFDYFDDTGYLYLLVNSGFMIIDTKKTKSAGDDTIVLSIKDHFEYLKSASWLHTPSHQEWVYMNSGQPGLSVLKVAGDDIYTSEGSSVSVPMRISDTPTGSFNYTVTNAGSGGVSMQYRTAASGTVWRDDMNDLNSYGGDYYSWGGAFQNVVSSDGIISFSQPVNSWGEYLWFDTGKSEDFFPAGSTVQAKLRMNTVDPSKEFLDYLYTDDWEDQSTSYSVVNDWIHVHYTPSMPFSKIGLEPWILNGVGWSVDDIYQVDWMSVSPADGMWSAWSTPCSSSTGCLIDPADLSGKEWIQYRVNFNSNDQTGSPVVSEVTFMDNYYAEGEFVSKVIDGGGHILIG